MLVTCCLREQKYYFRKNIQWAKNIFHLLVTVAEDDDLGMHREDVEGGVLSRVHVPGHVYQVLERMKII